MSTDRPFAIHITSTCFGTWLPGDPRGYVSNTLQPDGSYERKQNLPGAEITADDPATKRRAKTLQKSPTVWLTPELARCAAEALLAATQSRGWRILRASVMANHVHVVITECPDEGPVVRRVLKGVSQAALSRWTGEKKMWWTQGGSDRYKHDQAAIDAAVAYVARQANILAVIVDGCVEVPPG